MPLPTTCTLEYHVTPTNVTAVRMQAAIAAVPLYSNALTDPVLFTLLGCTVFSDTSSTVAGVVKRVIVLTLSPQFFALFPNPTAWANVFSGFYKYTLALALSSIVTEVPALFA